MHSAFHSTILQRCSTRIFVNAFRNSVSNPNSSASAMQIGPVNVNISIRIKSPGNDGPVAQTNLVQVRTAISVAVPAVVVSLPPAVERLSSRDCAGPEPASSDARRGATGRPGGARRAEHTRTPEAMLPFATMPLLPTVRVALTIAPISLGSTVISPSFRLGQTPLQAWTARPAGRRRRRQRKTQRNTTQVGKAAARTVCRRRLPSRRSCRRSRRASLPHRSRGGGSGGGGLPLALAIPFAVAFLDAGFRRLRASPGTPSSVAGRRPERPG